MKKKLLLALAISMMLVCFFAISIGAESVHEGKVDLDAKVTLDNGTVCNLFDAEGNALIWYNDASGVLTSIRADDSRVKYKATYAFGVGNSTVGSVSAYEVSDMWIALDSGNISKTNIVVLNLMDDDVLINEASNSSYLNNPVNCHKTTQWANTVLEYAYLRLDTVAIQQQAFNGCSKLKYINLEDLTELRQIGGATSFGGCSKLFAGETLDLTDTKLCAISGTGAFNGVPLAGLLLPDTVTSMGDWNIQGTAITSFVFPKGVATIAGSQFNDCKSLATIYINNTTTKINDRAFNNTALEKIFFVGTEAELNALLDNTGANNNAPFWAVVGENRENIISYADYLALEDKSGSYAVYGYSYCDAYNDGNHNTEAVEGSGCLGICTICQATSMLENPVHAPKDVLSFAGSETVDYYANMSVLSICEHCKTQTNAQEYGSIFVKKGFSVAENDTTAISFHTAINHKALAVYEEIAETTVQYGLLVSAVPSANPITGVVDGELVLAQNTLKINMTGTDYTNFSVKITGLPANQTLNCCGYVVEGEAVTYLNHTTASAEAETVSHAIALELQNSTQA